MEPKSLNELQNMSPADLLKEMRENLANKSNKPLVAKNEYEQFLITVWSDIFLDKTFDTLTDFFELGGSSLEAVIILDRVKHHYQIELDLPELFTATTIEKQAQLLIEFSSEVKQQGTTVDYQQDIDEIDMLNLAGTTFDNKPIKSIFLTGATGYLGIHILKELVKNPELHVYCLVRGKNSKEAKERILSIANKYHILFNNDEEKKITFLCGNLEDKKLGLSEDDFNTLTNGTDLIIHSAATVNFLYSYDMLRKANVQSLYELMKISIAGKMKPIHFISSIGVFNQLFTTDLKFIDEGTVFSKEPPISGYFQSKWVCEKMCHKARAKGIPIAVYRPSGISVNTQTHETSSEDLTYTLLRLSKKIGSFSTMTSLVDIVSVDYVAQAIVELVLNHSYESNNYHLTSGQNITLTELTKKLEAHAITESLSEDAFIKKAAVVAKNTDDEQIKNVLPLLISKQFSSSVNQNNTVPLFKSNSTEQLLSTVKKPDMINLLSMLIDKL